jgi:hypothetical protein
MVQAISGLPPMGNTFFLGMRLDPPRAGMTAMHFMLILRES